MADIIHSWLNSATLLGVLITLIVGLFNIGKRIGALELKVDTMWSFTMRRAWAEAISKDVINLHREAEE